MEKFFNDELQTQLKEILSQMVHDVHIVLFTNEQGCASCDETKQLLVEFESLIDKIHVEYKDIHQDKDLAKEYAITMTPSFVVLDANKKYKGVKFNGIPAGHEINSFIGALIEMSGFEVQIPETMVQRIKAINKPVNIKVFVTLSCPHCPGAVQTAHRLAMLNPNIQGEMIEANTFKELSIKHKVSGVPKIIINDHYELVGNQPMEAFLKEIEKI
jgi:glutaredoxin-like protein